MVRGYSEVVFSLTDLRIAAYNPLTGVYGTAIQFAEPQKFEFKPSSDNDSIMSYGRTTHLLTVIKEVEFTVSGAGLDFAALVIMLGMANVSSNTTPNRIRRATVSFGGSGLPYFGAVGQLMGENGDDLHIGLPICKLDTMPGWSTEQNKYIIPESAGKGIANSSGKGVYLVGHETAASPDFNDIFA